MNIISRWQKIIYILNLLLRLEKINQKYFILLQKPFKISRLCLKILVKIFYFLLDFKRLYLLK